MTVVSACFGILLLVYCSFQSVDCSCSDCQTAYYQCFGMCISPNDCTTCANEKEACEIEYNCASVKRSSTDWRPASNPQPAFIHDENDDLPLGRNQDQILKHLLHEILEKREKNIKH